MKDIQDGKYLGSCDTGFWWPRLLEFMPGEWIFSLEGWMSPNFPATDWERSLAFLHHLVASPAWGALHWFFSIFQQWSKGDVLSADFQVWKLRLRETKGSIKGHSKEVMGRARLELTAFLLRWSHCASVGKMGFPGAETWVQSPSHYSISTCHLSGSVPGVGSLDALNLENLPKAEKTKWIATSPLLLYHPLCFS